MGGGAERHEVKQKIKLTGEEVMKRQEEEIKKVKRRWLQVSNTRTAWFKA